MREQLRRAAIGLVIVAVAAIGTFAATGAQAASESPDEKVTFTLGLTDDMVTANPFKACCSTEYEMLFANYDMLYHFDPDTLAPVSGLAEYPPETSADGKTWTFNIRDDVTWQDGVPLTAKDVAFTYNLINEKGLSTSDYLGYPIAKDAFEAPDDTTLIWHMKTPTTSPLTPPWIQILPEHIWGKYMDPQYTAADIKGFDNIPAIGSGPFQLVEWQEGQFFRMEANPDYWGGAPNIDEIVFRIYGNPESLKLALTSGEVDAVEALTPSVFDSLEGEDNVTRNVSSAGYLDHVAFNFEGTANPALRDEKVRDALALAIDRQALVDRVTLGYASPGASILLPTFSKWAWEPSPDQVQGYDPEAAKAMLEDAGYTDSDGDGIREDPDGNPLALELLTISDVTYSVPNGKLVAGYFQDVGIDATIKTVTKSKAYDLWANQDFDMYFWGWGGDPDPDFMLSINTSDQCLVWSDGCYSDPAYDKLYKEQKLELDETKRQEVVTNMQEYLYDKNSSIVLFYETDLQAYRSDRFTGFVKQPEDPGYLYFAYGPYSYMNIEPVSGSGDTSSSSAGVPTAVWIGLAAAAAAGIAFVAFRRRGSGADSE
jgi:peptide/nickel transport system substrate-binding protein